MRFIGIESASPFQPTSRGFAGTCAEMRVQWDDGREPRRRRLPIMALSLGRQWNGNQYAMGRSEFMKLSAEERRELTARHKASLAEARLKKSQEIRAAHLRAMEERAATRRREREERERLHTIKMQMRTLRRAEIAVMRMREENAFLRVLRIGVSVPWEDLKALLVYSASPSSVLERLEEQGFFFSYWTAHHPVERLSQRRKTLEELLEELTNEPLPLLPP